MDQPRSQSKGHARAAISIYPLPASKIRSVFPGSTDWIDDLPPVGSFVRVSPTEIAVSDLAAFKTVHKVGSPFTKSQWYQKFNESSHPGIFALIDPREHGVRRRLFAQSFSNTSMLKFETVIRNKVDLAVSKIKRDALAGQADILRWFTFLATDTIGELSFGRSFDMLEHERVSIQCH